ncbi:ATP-binding protein [Anabaena cylindrica FACHB-243]|uniref:site-specific DNA-methyltransferase (adenine-specific) n=1 Tax=Anabaena cylindrica (strain ATCC 27899 / PCC 7122) TaxID=272123 RepID=K9ZSB5_ANACC|nr:MULTISPECIES: DNA methyltransferase [Anabaena]AFZ61427.1 putative transcriptional regulator [Anabaena cylindrica PCC 7122]MBD2419570.1 ATP-binding protein [Anabaena cylindrica FACHB-243]MBY5284160.1 ATP-binding protein [Anabaena sp. CCAP 1446/1C]MBY5309319.1 ATP-binding protein [Anabaena sp. CCAP 1446/1C]MCM2409770.1 ATP-binding protein [Anabaena sp. CCAP 1446/1C]
MTIDYFTQCRELLQNFNFQDLFIQQLGWESPGREKPVVMEVDGENYTRSKIAELAGAVVFEITSESGQIPNAKILEAIYREISQLHLENLLIFIDGIDGNRTQSLWYWVKREGSKIYPRDHVYVKTQAGDLLLSKISALRVSIEEIEDITVIDIAERLQRGFDVERVTKDFFNKFQEQHTTFLSLIKGIDNEVDRRWYTSVLLNRLMFVYFLQRKGFIKGFADDNDNTQYLKNQLTKSQESGENLFYKNFLNALFFEGFAKPEEQRSQAAKALIGDVKYLNGGLFLKHKIEQEYNNIFIPDSAFENVLNLFAKFSWNLDDTPGGKDNEINPYVLGYIFEKYINQKAFGAYYTRPEITAYLCDRTINKLILDQVNQLVAPRKFDSINDLITKLDGSLCQRLLYDILPNLSLLDPACGSGAFLIAAMQTLIYIYSSVIATIEIRIKDPSLKQRLDKERAAHTSLQYYIKKQIITNNLFGVDIMPEAIEIAKLRLFLELVASAHTVDELEPLPNIDFNIMAGNSLIGLIRVDETAFDAVGETKQGNLLQALAADNYQKILAEKNESIELYKKHAFLPGEEHGTDQDDRLLILRQHIDKLNQESQAKLNSLLSDEFSKRLGIKYEEVQLTGKSKKRVLNIQDIEELKPFHWGYHFDKVLGRGGFDAIITNPPWEIFKPNAREFFLQHNELVRKTKMNIKDFEKEQKKLLQNPEIADAWLQYQSEFPHVSAYYRSAEQYKNQISVVNGKKSGTDINLYKLFVEQCFNLLREGGECGIIIPSGIYTDLGTKQLREMLFTQTKIDTLFGLSNEKFIFEGVHHAFKFCLLTFEKAGLTNSFMSAFRINPREAVRVNELDVFLYNKDEQINISVPLIRRLSPDSLSVMEFKNDVDIRIAEKMLKFPLLGENINGKWNLRLTAEFHMTSDSKLFQQQAGKGKLPLYEGKMIHQFTHLYAEPRYWVDEQEGRKALLGKNQVDEGQTLDYQTYRLAFRSVASSTNERSLISSILPQSVFCGNSLLVSQTYSEDNQVAIDNQQMLFAITIFNSFVIDYYLRQKVTTNLNMFFVYQLPVPRLMEGDKYFNEIVGRSAKLIFTTPAFDEIAQEVGLSSYKDGIIDEVERGKIKAELDGIIAHIYGLTEEEFASIIRTFPLVPEPVKITALNAYRDVERGLIKI